MSSSMMRSRMVNASWLTFSITSTIAAISSSFRPRIPLSPKYLQPCQHRCRFLGRDGNARHDDVIEKLDQRAAGSHHDDPDRTGDPF